jgi:hypothetical protein
VNFGYNGEWYSIPRSVYDQIQEIQRTTPDPFVQFRMIGELLIPYGYVPEPPQPPPPEPPPQPPPNEYVNFGFNGVLYSIPRLVYDEIQRLQATITDPFQLFRAINALLVPYGAPPTG